mmetsp:Transcript_21193/g.41105  ORF Transcript_21193/g.41105 Transcript_21193/m.41105 type:complete len:234 (+) Transcript_21193:54-755(+)
MGNKAYCCPDPEGKNNALKRLTPLESKEEKEDKMFFHEGIAKREYEVLDEVGLYYSRDLTDFSGVMLRKGERFRPKQVIAKVDQTWVLVHEENRRRESDERIKSGLWAPVHVVNQTGDLIKYLHAVTDKSRDEDTDFVVMHRDKLHKLRKMGFKDIRANIQALRAKKGSVMQAMEILVAATERDREYSSDESGESKDNKHRNSVPVISPLKGYEENENKMAQELRNIYNPDVC